MSEVNWTQVRRAAEEARIEASCMHGTSCHDVLCVERQARGECLAVAAEVLADLGPVLDAFFAAVRLSATSSDGAVDMNYDVCMDALLTAWTTARAKLVTT